MRSRRASKLALPIIFALLAISMLIVEKELAHRSPSGASPLNPGPEGTSSLVEVMRRLGYEAIVVTSWSDELVRLRPCLVVLISPELPYTDGELKVLKELASSGVRLLIADEGEHSNEVLKSLGVPARIAGDVVLLGDSSVFQVEVSLGGRELRALFAHSSSLQLLPAHNGSLEVIARLGNRVLGVLYESEQLKVAILGDGTVLTNALINPINSLNSNYVLARELLRELCPSGGAVLIEGSKYKQKPVGPGAVALLDPLGKTLGVALLASISMYLALSRESSSAAARRAPRSTRGVYAYGVVRKLCSDEMLAKVLSCDLLGSRKPEEILRRAIEACRGSKEVAARILRVLGSS